MLTYLFAAIGVLALVAWLVRRGERRTSAGRFPGWESAKAPIDRAELEAAEREVRDLEPDEALDDETYQDDWGPGTGRPRPPDRL